eukprot:jgi/Undpi1/3922/HiC_scaffold_16.g07290.m1
MEESHRTSVVRVDPPSPADATRVVEPGSSSNGNRNGSRREDGQWRRRSAAISPFVVGFVAVLAASALAWHLMGAGIVMHFFVLLNYLAANIDAGGSGSVPSQLHSSRTASPIHWVGETVEGSLNWLRGGVAASSSNGAVGRRRSRSMGGPLLLGTEGTVSGAGSAATSPGGSIGRGGGNASPASGRRIGFGRAAAEAALGRALPVLGAGIPQGQLARARAWSRTFGSGGQQGLSSPPAVARAGARGGGGLAIDAYDGDGSMDGDGGRGGGGDRGMRAGGDWLVGAGMGDESESGSLSSAANGWRGGSTGGRSRNAGAESDGRDSSLADLKWEVDGRRQALRRSSLR